MFCEKGGEVCSIAVGQVVIREGYVLWTKSHVEVAKYSQKVVRWDISDSCSKVLIEFFHLVRWCHVRW